VLAGLRAGWLDGNYDSTMAGLMIVMAGDATAGDTMTIARLDEGSGGTSGNSLVAY
jgi:hypothetical protein